MNQDPRDTVTELIADTSLAIERLEQFNDNPSVPLQTWYRVAIGEFVSISNSMDEAAKSIGIRGIAEKMLTRTAMAELMDVHPHTVSRWITAATVAAPQESDRDHPPVT